MKVLLEVGDRVGDDHRPAPRLHLASEVLQAGLRVRDPLDVVLVLEHVHVDDFLEASQVSRQRPATLVGGVRALLPVFELLLGLFFELGVVDFLFDVLRERVERLVIRESPRLGLLGPLLLVTLDGPSY